MSESNSWTLKFVGNGDEVTKYEEDVLCPVDPRVALQFLFGVMIIEGPQLLDLPAMDGYEQPTSM